MNAMDNYYDQNMNLKGDIVKDNQENSGPSGEDKTHYRKAFNSPYLSSQDIIEPTTLTIKQVRLEPDKSKKTKDNFNTAYFVEGEIRSGEQLKPMILNATNSRTMRDLTGSSFIDDWNNVSVMVYVDPSVRFGRDTVEGLRISTEKPKVGKPELKPNTTEWTNAIASYLKYKTFDKIELHRTISDENKELIKKDAKEMEDVG